MPPRPARARAEGESGERRAGRRQGRAEGEDFFFVSLAEASLAEASVAEASVAEALKDGSGRGEGRAEGELLAAGLRLHGVDVLVFCGWNRENAMCDA